MLDDGEANDSGDCDDDPDPHAPVAAANATSNPDTRVR
jgi:hypothetical protein